MIEYTIAVLGWIGALFFLMAYYQVIQRKWKLEDSIYHLFNLLGGIFLIINTLYLQAWAASFINFAWGLMALIGYVKSRKNTQASARDSEE